MRIQTSKDMLSELLCVLSWSEEARLAYVKALRSYQRAGSPGIPLGVRDYRKTFKKRSS